MPWRNYYYRRRRRRWNRYWRPRKTVRRRYYWRRRRQPVRRKKLKSIILRELQPKKINKCKITGFIPLFWGPPERFVNNYESYEMSIAPEKIPSGGLFGIKNFNLEALFAEHQQVRNIWTKTNNTLPLVRYTGCQFKFYKSNNTDYIVSYDNNMPMKSSLDLYETLHPGVHFLLKNKIVVSSTQTTTKGKLYKKIKISPPAPLQNKWYFQADISRTPLCQIRTSATSLNSFYIHPKSISTSMTITYLNPTAITNTCFKTNPPQGYYSKKTPAGDNVYLYSAKKEEIKEGTQIHKIIFLGNTQHNYEGETFPDKKSGEEVTQYIKRYDKTKWGNPFHTKYLNRTYRVYQSTTYYNKMAQKMISSNPTIEHTDSFTEVFLTDAKRYNSFNDDGSNNTIFLKSVKDTTDGWSFPEDQDLIQSGLPLWILTFGFVDFLKKAKRNLKIDDEWMVVLKTKHTTEPTQPFMPLLDVNFIQGNSPYEKQPNPLDQLRWYPSTQMQQVTINNISLSGPGSPKQPPLESIQAIAKYTFYFKWGGNPPPMDSITDPQEQIQYHIPTNFRKTNSLQNPATSPEYFLYSFDERRGQLTDKAIKRLQKDYETSKTFISDGSRFQPEVYKQETTSPETTTSEEEEETENLLLKLRKQRLKHKRLKHRIMEKLKLLQTTE
nr:MAG: ORF1 [TTV-like mini virus]